MSDTNISLEAKRNRLLEQQKALKDQEVQLLHQLNKAEKRKEYVSSAGRKQRTHRLVTRGAAIESLIPETKELTEVEFFSAAESFFEDDEIRNRFLSSIASARKSDIGRAD